MAGERHGRGKGAAFRVPPTVSAIVCFRRNCSVANNYRHVTYCVQLLSLALEIGRKLLLHSEI
jgi:hypothetical protein